jgi:putative transposase
MWVARSSFYAVSSGAPDKTALVAETRAICAAFPAYGYRRVGAELRHRGLGSTARSCGGSCASRG